MRGPVAFLGLLAGLFAATDGQARDCVAAGRPMNADYARDHADDWRDEAARLKRDERLVARQQDRLRLVLDGGKALELVDCPYGDDAHWYLFERYDRAGRFYVVRTRGPDDFSYTLVMLPTGGTYTVHGSPVWAAEKSRFLTVACSLDPPRASLFIRAPDGGTIATEAEFPLPCASESCSARWDHESWISVACAPRDGSGKRGSEFVLVRNDKGAWQKFGR